jgi:hypothetical protein
MDSSKRDELIAKMAESATDNASTEALSDYFYQGQVEVLDEKEDNWLIDKALEMGVIDSGDLEDYE